MDGGAWLAAVHGVARSQTRLSDFTFTFHFHALEKEMTTHSSVLALRIPGTGEPGGLPSIGSHRVGHDWSNLAAAAAAVSELSRIVRQPVGGRELFCGVGNPSPTSTHIGNWGQNPFTHVFLKSDIIVPRRQFPLGILGYSWNIFAGHQQWTL